MKRFFQLAKTAARESVGGFLRHNCTIHAAGLTYYSILTLVPVICLLLIVARPLGADVYAREKMNEYFDSFVTSVETAPDITDAVAVVPNDPAERARRREAAQAVTGQMRSVANQFFDFFAKVDFSTFGWIGLATLLWTVISTLGTVEVSLNSVWDVRKNRPLWKRCVLYAFVSAVLPLLVVAALSIPVLSVVERAISATASVTPLTRAVGDFLVGALSSTVFNWCFTMFFASAAFSFFFKCMPNAPVSTRAALEGGAVIAVAFGAWLKICAVAQVGIIGASKLYGTFAVLPIALAWSYVGWQIVLFGANLTYALQNLHGRVARGDCA